MAGKDFVELFLISALCENASSSSEEFSSDDEEELDNLLKMHSKQSEVQLAASTSKLQNYVDEAISHYVVEDFRNNFRMSRATFTWLILQLGPYLTNMHEGRPTTDPRKQLLIALWLLGSQESYRFISDRFDVSKQTVWSCVHRVSKTLVSLAPTYIMWPTGQKAKEVAGAFQAIVNLPRVIGVVDSTHISIKTPVSCPESYVNIMGTHSIVLQAVVDHEYYFTDCYAGQVGGLQDGQIFQISDLMERLNVDKESLLPEDSHLVADLGYPLLPYLLTPYPDDGQLTEMQSWYNTVLAETCRYSEHAFTLLKGRFRRLKYYDMQRTDLISPTILACCVLHNICQMKMDNGDDFMEPPENMDTCTVQFANTLEDSVELALASDKRDQIAELLFTTINK